VPISGEKSGGKKLQAIGKEIFFVGADPQIWSGNPSDFGGICSPYGVLVHSVEILATALKTMEISRVK